MKRYALPLLLVGALATTEVVSPQVYLDGAKIYAPVSNVDQGFGTFIQNNLNYAFQEPPASENWYMSNDGGADLPHWKYLANAEIGPVDLTKAP
ncbi:hypothetical protein NQ176_g2314 [Zarea fungicola]|uniref:Uncharacterized protein n=1 Tax=Zarea fungicola TaxID=93591 RepID=A0ACC1NPX6_9HYPO|nr:hypothetical protein NQ176_g2314 [Lecanicillium fungicola]